MDRSILEGNMPIFGYPVLGYQDDDVTVQERQFQIKSSLMGSIFKARPNLESPEIIQFINAKNNFSMQHKNLLKNFSKGRITSKNYSPRISHRPQISKLRHQASSVSKN